MTTSDVLCHRCRTRPRAAGQRWCRECRTDAQRDRRERLRARAATSGGEITPVTAEPPERAPHDVDAGLSSTAAVLQRAALEGPDDELAPDVPIETHIIVPDAEPAELNGAPATRPPDDVAIAAALARLRDAEAAYERARARDWRCSPGAPAIVLQPLAEAVRQARAACRQLGVPT